MDLTRNLLQELDVSRRKSGPKEAEEKARTLFRLLTPSQAALVRDQAHRKAALCPRRSGKSWAVLFYLLITCLRRPRANCLCIGVTRGNAKGVYWSLLKTLCKEHEIKAHFHNTELACTFENEARITFSGADTAHEIEKFRGQAYDLVCIDECKSYSSGLFRDLIIEVIEPALSDRLGTLVLIGTPGAILAGPFFEITTQTGEWNVKSYKPNTRAGGFAWSLHSWSCEDNVAAPWIWERAQGLKKDAGWPDEHPTWQREYLGKWAVDLDAMVYAYASITDGRCDLKRDIFSKNPHGLQEDCEWHYLLGVDLGWHDDVGLVVGAWSRDNPALHFIHSEKHPRLTLSQIAARVVELESLFGRFDVRVADTGGLGKTIVESLQRDYGLTFVAARKQDKGDHIKIMGSDQLAGRIKVEPESALAEEWRTLQWMSRDGKVRIEDPSCPNHAADAALYLWRWAHYHLYQEKEKAVQPGSDAWWQKQEKDEEEAVRRRVLFERNNPWWTKFKTKLDQRRPDRKSISRLLRDSLR